MSNFDDREFVQAGPFFFSKVPAFLAQNLSGFFLFIGALTSASFSSLNQVQWYHTSTNVRGSQTVEKLFHVFIHLLICLLDVPL